MFTFSWCDIYDGATVCSDNVLRILMGGDHWIFIRECINMLSKERVGSSCKSMFFCGVTILAFYLKHEGLIMLYSHSCKAHAHGFDQIDSYLIIWKTSEASHLLLSCLSH